MGVLIFLLLVAVAVPLASFDLRLFAVYAFAALVALILGGFARFWRLYRVAHFSNAAKLILIARKVGVATTDYDKLAAELEAADPRGFKQLVRDFRNLQS